MSIIRIKSLLIVILTIIIIKDLISFKCSSIILWHNLKLGQRETSIINEKVEVLLLVLSSHVLLYKLRMQQIIHSF